MMKNKYPALFQFFGCYFHQDWPVDYDSWDSAIDAFVKSEPSESIRAAKLELEQILDSGCSESEVLDILLQLGCYYDPTGDDTNVFSWLQYVRKRLVSPRFE